VGVGGRLDRPPGFERLEGRRFVDVHEQRSLVPLAERVVPFVNRLLERLRQAVYAFGR
jgi:hypothetical protein